MLFRERLFRLPILVEEEEADKSREDRRYTGDEKNSHGSKTVYLTLMLYS